jgi:Trk K+ transport system NAD-binding subunit
MNTQHVIVSGDDALTATIAAELKDAGVIVVRLDDAQVADTEVDLEEAGIGRALAVVCGADDDSTNLEIALLARTINPDVRVVARLTNDVLGESLTDVNGPGAIFNVAEIAAPAIVDACLAHGVHTFEAAGIRFGVYGSSAPRSGSLRELYGELSPVAVIRGENASAPGELEISPRRDRRVDEGDWVVLLGTDEAAAAVGVSDPRPTRQRSHRLGLRRILDAGSAFVNDVNPAFYPVVAAVFALTAVSTLVLRFGHENPRMGWVDAMYFTIETITTTGYGDFSFVNQPTWLRLFAAMLMFGGVTTIALLVAFIGDVLLSQRFIAAATHPRIGRLHHHIVVVGLSALGIRVVRDLVTAGHEVAVIEIDEENKFLAEARALDVPVVFGDATLHTTLEAARVERARAITVLTHDDMINIETGMVLAKRLGRRLAPMHHRPNVPLVLRVFDRALGFALAQRLGFVNARSTVELAAPWFIGAAIGLDVLDTFSVGQHSFVVGAMSVAPDSELDGLHLYELSTYVRVIAITRTNQEVELHPRRNAQLRAADTAYVVGPYRELLGTLRKGQAPIPSSATGRNGIESRQPHCEPC